MLPACKCGKTYMSNSTNTKYETASATSSMIFWLTDCTWAIGQQLTSWSTTYHMTYRPYMISKHNLDGNNYILANSPYNGAPYYRTTIHGPMASRTLPNAFGLYGKQY